MDPRYACSSQKRRQKVLDGVDIGGGVLLLGIDFLEVVDTALIGTAISGARQRLLVLRALHPVLTPIVRANVAIDGGVRVTPIRLLWAQRLRDVLDTPDPAVDPDERAWLRGVFLQGLPDAPTDPPTSWDDPSEWAGYGWDEPEHWIVLRCEEQGDFSTYTLRLVSSGDLPLAGWDRVLSRVDFSFKVECPSAFDCATEEEETPPSSTPPYIDYLARDFSSFRRLMLDRLSIILPDWKETSTADLGHVLIDLVAYAADHLSYYQDAVATEAYLSTARRRISVRRHARLLDYRMHEGCNARAWVHLTVADGQELVGSATSPALPAGTPVLTWLSDAPVLSAATYTAGLDRSPVVFETVAARTTLTWAQNAITVHTWGEDACCLDAGETSATLVVPDGGDLRLEVGDALVFEEVRSPDTGALADADRAHRAIVRLTEVGAPIWDPVVGVWVVDVAWGEEDALPTGFCLDTVTDASGDSGPVTLARSNLVLVDHGRTIDSDQEEAEDPSHGGPLLAGEALVPEQVHTDGRRYRPRLKQTGLTWRARIDLSASSAGLLAQDPREAVPALTLSDSRGTTWSPVPDLLGSDDFAPDVVVEMESDRRAWLRFGDGEYGRAPTVASTFRATYRVGNGAAGNVGADALVHLVSDTLGGAITGVRNPIPATGGTDPESLDAVRLYAPVAFREQQRAVTLADWVAITEKHPDVQRAAATLRWTGSWHTVFLTVDRKGGLPIDPTFEDALLTWLEPYRLAGYDLEINAPKPVSLDIALSVCVAPGYYRANVEQALLRVFSAGLLSDGTRGFFHPDNFTFGQPVYLSAFVAAAMTVPGVAWVDTTPNLGVTGTTFVHRFARMHEPDHGELQRGYIAIESLECARLDSDPNRPENGRLTFSMRGGL